MLVEVQFEVDVASVGEYFLCLNYFGRQTVTMNDHILTKARLDKLWRNLESFQVALPSFRIGSENLDEFREGSLGQTLYLVRPCIDRFISLANGAN